MTSPERDPSDLDYDLRVGLLRPILCRACGRWIGESVTGATAICEPCLLAEIAVGHEPEEGSLAERRCAGCGQCYLGSRFDDFKCPPCKAKASVQMLGGVLLALLCAVAGVGLVWLIHQSGG